MSGASSSATTYTPPPSSQPPNDGRFGLRLSVPSHIAHYHTPLTPIAFLLRAALIAPKDKLAVVHPAKGVQYTYVQWAARCLSLTFAIRQTHGWRKGDRVAVIAPNSPMILEAHHAILAAGGIDTPLNIRNNAQEIQYVLQHSGARVILVDEECVHLLPSKQWLDAQGGITVIVSKDTGGRNGIDADPYEQFLQIGHDAWKAAERAEAKQYGEKAKRGWELINVPDDENDACCLCYTSGTTGRPKGVLTSHRGSYLAAIANAFESQLSHDSVYLWILPAFHAAGWTFPWAICAALGTHYILRKVDNEQIWHALHNDGVTHYCGAPTVNIGLVHHPLAKRLPHVVRVGIAASAPTADLLAKMEGLNLQPVHLYGQTENYGPFTRCYAQPSWASLSLEERAKLMSRQGHGFLVSDEVRVVKVKSEEDSAASNSGGRTGSTSASADGMTLSTLTGQDERELVDVQRDGKEVGEIVMRGNLAMLSYYNNAEATGKTIRHGWLHTGDLAVRHPDGSIAIADRAKDIIISGGENISSLMVEDNIASHKGVLECCVVARPHEKWGEVGHCFIVRKQDANNLNSDDLRNFLRGRISKFAVPMYFDFVEELPKTSTGKVQKNVLRNRVRQAKL